MGLHYYNCTCGKQIMVRPLIVSGMYQFNVSHGDSEGATYMSTAPLAKDLLAIMTGLMDEDCAFVGRP